MFERKEKITVEEGEMAATILLAAMMAPTPASACGFEVKGEYYGISRQEADAFMFDGATIRVDTTGQLVLPKLEGSWTSGSSIRITDIGVITVKVVTGDSGPSVIEYTAKAPGKTQPIVVVENGTAANMGTFYVTAVQDGDTAAAGWVQENGQWRYEMGGGTYKNDGRLADQEK